MERLSDDEVGQIMRRISRSDRRVCAQVCVQWRRVEGLTRRYLRILDPLLLHSFLPHFRNLLVIEAAMEITDGDLACIAENCPSLQVFNLGLSKFRRVMDLEYFTSYQDVVPMGDDGIVAIANRCKDLQHVSLRWRQGIGDKAISALARSCVRLSHLDLGHCKRITDRALEELSRLSSMEVLILRDCSLITDWGITSLMCGPTAKSLKRLDLWECDQLTDSGALLFQKFQTLQTLNLAECGPRITDQGGVGLAGITTLRIVNLAWLINVSDVTIVELAQNCLDLIEVNLSGCELVTGVGLRAFSGHGKLRNLILSACSNIHSDDVDSTASTCPALEYLCLDRALRPWMSVESLERLQTRCEIEWM